MIQFVYLCFVTPQYASFAGVAMYLSNAEPASGTRTCVSSHCRHACTQPRTSGIACVQAITNT